MLKQTPGLTTLMLEILCVMFFCAATVSSAQVIIPTSAEDSHARERDMEAARRRPTLPKIHSANSGDAKGVLSTTPTFGREARRGLDNLRLWEFVKRAHFTGASEKRGAARRFDLRE